MARVLKARKNPFTVELLFLDGEEAFDRLVSGRPTTPTAAGTTSRRRSAPGDLARIKAMILVDMIGDRDLVIKRESDVDAVAHRHRSGPPRRRSATAPSSSTSRSPVEDDHVPFLNAGVPAVDIIDLELSAVAHRRATRSTR
ncbi:MAG: M28 family peptidase [Ignavibacteriales bacterium]|nr:M28 family peptidase [Ignavibacteriales bacterium]